MNESLTIKEIILQPDISNGILSEQRKTGVLITHQLNKILVLVKVCMALRPYIIIQRSIFKSKTQTVLKCKTGFSIFSRF